MQKKPKETPLTKQYNEIKVKYPDALLLFRVGDFYETFGEDAVKASSILGIILTKRGAGTNSETPLAGFPYHSLDSYLPKLVKAGCRVAICEQLENPKFTKTIVKRGVTELVTPGVVLSDSVLDHKKNNYLCAIFFGKINIGISLIDISTGDFFVGQGGKEIISQFLQNFSPSEILVSKPQKKSFEKEFGSNFPLFFLEDWAFENDFAVEKLTSHFETNSLQGFGVSDLIEGCNSGGAILHYLDETQHNKIKHITKIQRLVSSDYVWMDDFTIRNLELFFPTNQNGVSLISILDHTQTSMGARKMKYWLAFPSKNINEIVKRQGLVQAIIKNEPVYLNLAEFLSKIIDIERVMSKISTFKVAPRTLVQLNSSLNIIPKILKVLNDSGNKNLKNKASNFPSLKEIIDILENTLDPEAPASISKGNIIAKGVSVELDDLRKLLLTTKSHLDELLNNEIKRTNIGSLKIAYNNVYGYYIEVRNTHKNKVPEEWVRKQTLVNAERYITPELKEYESKIMSAQERIGVIEYNIYNKIIDAISEQIIVLKNNANIISFLDCLLSFSKISTKYNYVKPVINNSSELRIVKGRHPVIEQQLENLKSYIPNDIILNQQNQQLIMITGPNMSGKSAILRQTALIVLMAQIGCFVPAENVEIGIVDKIFTRVGASDNISMGESTFMVEMNETASILNNLSKNSLILLDEIGRGTSTYDGISIAWSIAEYIHEHNTKAKTLFATHYHELNEMTNQYERIKNYNVSIKRKNGEVIFMRTLKEGGSNHSFGIHVAKMAGMPIDVVKNAEGILKQLQSSRNTSVENVVDNKKIQLSFFDVEDPIMQKIREMLIGIDIDSLTPIEALMKLNEIKKTISDKL